MDQQTLLNYLIQKDRTLANTAVNSTLAGTMRGIEPIKAERAILAALADCVRNSSLPKHQKGVVGVVKEAEVAAQFVEAPAPLVPAPDAPEGPEFDPEPEAAQLAHARASQEAAEKLIAQDPNLAPSPPAQFAKNKGGRPRKDGTPVDSPR